MNSFTVITTRHTMDMDLLTVLKQVHKYRRSVW